MLPDSNDIHIGVLLPARLETRFIEPGGEDENGQPIHHWTLKIAVIPDDPWMKRHSDVASDREAQALAALWTALRELAAEQGRPNTEDALREVLQTQTPGRVAFGRLAQQVGPARAWWLVRRFGPDAPLTIGQKPLSRMDDVPEQIEIWLGLKEGAGIALQRLEPPMVVNRAALTFDKPDEHPLHLFGNGRWWTQEAGLQKEYPLPFVEEPGQIELIIAVGLGSASPRALFENHRNAGLLSLLPLGTATNTVSGEPAADLAQDPDLWWQLLSSPGEEQTRRDIALALAGDEAAMDAIPGGTRDHAELNQNLVRAVWPALWGHALKDVWCIDFHENHWRGLSFEIGEWAQRWLYPEGHLAPIRIGDQPYGLWPVTRLNDGKWKRPIGDPTNLVVEYDWLPRWLPETRRMWAQRARSGTGTVAGADADRLVQLLGRTPSASAYGYRTFLPLQVMCLLAGSLLGPGSVDQQMMSDTADSLIAASDALGFGLKPMRRYVTSGWRQDLVLPLVEPPRVTHLAGASSGGVLFYNAPTGEGASASLDQTGAYRYGAAIVGFNLGWTHIVPMGDSQVFFYQSDAIVGAISRIDEAGHYEFVNPVQRVTAGWTHVAATPAGGLLFYRAGTSNGQVGRVDGSENYRVVRSFTDFHSRWTHIVSANQDGLLFYDGASGLVTTARLKGDGVYTSGPEQHRLTSGYTHVVGTVGGGVLYYNAATGEAQAAWLDDAARHHLADPIPGIAAGWTHVTGAGSDGVLFYDAMTGAAATARLDSTGNFQFIGSVAEALQDGRSLFFEQVARIVEIDEQAGVAALFLHNREMCVPGLPTDSLLVRLILNSIALLQAEFGQMSETRDFSGQPLIDHFQLDPQYCSDLQKWCDTAGRVFLHDISSICTLLHLSIADCERVEQWPIVQMYQNLYWTLHDWLDSYRGARVQVESGDAGAVRRLLADIERAFRATLDTAAMRIDPWITGMAAQRLSDLRMEKRNDGLGLYAWVDKPYTGLPGPTEGGTLLAPSHSQLLTSIILRDKHINDFQTDRWKIELDSRKIRLARQFADEVRAGAHIQEVLGRAVEGIIGNDEQIKQMRKRFRIREEHAGRRVCDGQKVLATNEGQMFFDGLDLSEQQKMALEELRIVTDTYGDLLVANAVHAIVAGQPEKAGETMDAASGLELPPELDVLRTPLAGHSVNTTVWLALPDSAQPNAGDPDASPALLADAAVATFLELAVPAHHWTWTVVDPGGAITVTLADLGMRVSETLAYGEDALVQLALRHGAGGATVDDFAGEAPPAPGTLAHRRLRRLATTLAARVRNVHNVPDEDEGSEDSLASLWREHDAELRDRFATLLAAARLLRDALNPDRDDADALHRARRWGIAPAPLDDSLAPEQYQLTDAEQLQHQLKQAYETLDDRLRRAESVPGGAPPQQVAQDIAELSGVAMPIFGRATRAMIEVSDALHPHPTLDQTWLETVAAVRPALARIEAHQLGAEGRWNAWCTHADPWTFVQPHNDARVKQSMNVGVCYTPSDTLGPNDDGTEVPLAVAVVDSWSEMVPDKSHIVEAAFGFNAPSSRAPQAILLAVPPDVDRPLDGETLAHIVLEARETAHARMAVPDDISAYAALFPFSMLPAQQPTGVSMRPVDPFSGR